MSDILRVGTTEGRFRMVMPQLLAQYKALRPQGEISAVMDNADNLRGMLERGEIDIAFSGISPLAPACIEKELLFDERLYVVVSEHQLRGVFGSGFDAAVAELRAGADLRLLQSLPFARSTPNLHCMQILDRLLQREGITLNCIHVSPHFDLHQKLAAADYAACFCLSMYAPHLRELNTRQGNRLYLFPIKGLTEANPVYLLHNKEKPLPAGAADFARLLREVCAPLDAPQSDLTAD